MTVFLFYVFVLSVAFAHAPSYHYAWTTLPNLSAIALGLAYVLGGRYRRPDGMDYSVAGFLVVVFVSFYLNLAALHPKAYNHIAAYIFVMILMFMIPRHIVWTRDIDIGTVRTVLTVSLMVAMVYSIVELAYLLKGVDIGAMIPRYDREEYRFSSFSGLFRTRSFNYESAHYALLLNCFMPYIISVARGRAAKGGLLALYLLTLVSSFSVAQITFTVLVGLLIYRRYVPVFAAAALLLLLLIPGSTLDDIYGIFLSKLTLGMSSGETRSHLATVGLEKLAEHPFFGFGPAGFYFFLDSSTNNFYLNSMIQFGLAAVLPLLLFSLLILRRLRFISSKPLMFSFLVLALQMGVVGDFWLPQIWIFLLLVEIEYKTALLNAEASPIVPAPRPSRAFSYLPGPA